MPEKTKFPKNQIRSIKKKNTKSRRKTNHWKEIKNSEVVTEFRDYRTFKTPEK